MADKTFASGIIYKEPSPKAPDFVVGGLSIKKSEFIPFLQKTDGDWVNLKINLGKSGKPYIELDTWKPKVANDIPDVAPSINDNLPF